MMRRASWISMIVLTFGAPLAAHGQGQPRGQPDRPELERRVRARFGETVRAELGITQEQMQQVQRVEASFQEARRDLVRREIEVRRRMGRGQDRNRTDEEARALLAELAAVREEEIRLFRAEMDGLLEVLSAQQTLRFYELREQMMDRVRRLRGVGPGRGGPPGARGVPPAGR